MILQEEFEQNGYKSILSCEDAGAYQINLEDLFDLNDIPPELVGLYISEMADELFFVIDGDTLDINELCDTWDDRIRVFIIVNGKNSIIQALKYNIIQLIIYSNGIPDKNREGNLFVSRKIILKGNMADKNRILIDDDEAIELPFHMIAADMYSSDEEPNGLLSNNLPEDESVYTLLRMKHKKARRIEREGILDKSFNAQEFNKIKEWLGT